MSYDPKEVNALREIVKSSGKTIAACARDLNIPVSRAYSMLYTRKKNQRKARAVRAIAGKATQDIADFLDPKALDAIALKVGREVLKNYLSMNFS